MKDKFWLRKKLMLLTAAALMTFAISPNLVSAQEVLSATGGNASGSGGSASYTTGQVVYTTHADTGGSIIQGVQLAYEIFTVGIHVTTLDISLTVFPIPTEGNLTLKVNQYSGENLKYQVFDMQGKLLFAGLVQSILTLIDMHSLAPSTYMMHISRNNEMVQVFKIIKNH